MPLSRPRAYVLILCFIVCTTAPARAGTMSVRWDPSPSPSAIGYRIYYGQAPDTYSRSKDAGASTRATLSSLTNCSTWYASVKAYDAQGVESVAFSNEVSGWPRPIVSSVSPPRAEQGRTLTLTVSGANFRPGAEVRFSDRGVVVNSVVVDSCTRLRVSVTLVGPARTSGINVEVVDPDRVFGVGSSVFYMDAPTPPAVVATSPPDQAIDVATGVTPTVTFSEPMRGRTVNSSNVQLLDVEGDPVPQAAGSPTLSSDGRVATIQPMSVLGQSRRYRIQVIGGTSGVQDLAGLRLEATYIQPTGFRTRQDLSGSILNSVSMASVTSTSASTTWLSDEPTQGQLVLREAGTAEELRTELEPGMQMAHACRADGLIPGRVYELHVRSVDGAGNESISSPDLVFTTPDSRYAYLVHEAEESGFTAPLRAERGEGAIRGGWLECPAGVPWGGEDDDLPCRATVLLDVPYDGQWQVWARIGGDPGAGAWQEQLDGGEPQALDGDGSGWRWVPGRVHALPQGIHRLDVSAPARGLRLDRIVLTDDPEYVPGPAE